MMPGSHGLGGVCENGPESNLSVSGETNPEMPKTATQSRGLAVLESAEDTCGTEDHSSPKTATSFCGGGLSRAAA